MENKCKIVATGNDLFISQYNKEYDRTLYCYMRNGILKGVDFMEGKEESEYTKEDIFKSECSTILFGIFDKDYKNNELEDTEYFNHTEVSIEQALHLALHISEIYCNMYIYFIKW